MLCTWRRKRSSRNKPPAATSGSPTNPIDPELLRVQQLQLDEFAAQRVEHDRQFFELLSELDSGHRARQEQVSDLMKNVRLAFDAAQARRRDEWRTAQNDLREYAVKSQESCATQSEGSRDAAARDGFLRCEEQADHLRGLFDATCVQLDDWAATHELSRAAWTTLITRLRSVLDGQSEITLAPSTAPDPSLHHNFAGPHAGTRSTRLPAAGFLRQSDTLSQPDALSPQPFETGADMQALDSVGVTRPGETGSYRHAFFQLQFIRSRMRNRMSETHLGALHAWDTAFLSLEAELSAVFTYHPCVRGDSDGAVIAAATMLITFRAAESRRAMELQRSWQYHIRKLQDLVQSIWVHRVQGIHLRAALPDWSLQQPGSPSTVTDVPRLAGFHPQNLARVPVVTGPLPVVSSSQLQLEAYRRQQHILAQYFLRMQSEYRSEGLRSETVLCRQFSTALQNWETRAAQAELRRDSEFAHTLDRVRQLHEASIARNCHEVAMSLEREFEESQRSRERTFLCELERLHKQLLHVCSSFRDNLAAKTSDSAAEAVTLVPVAQTSAD